MKPFKYNCHGRFKILGKIDSVWYVKYTFAHDKHSYYIYLN